MFIPQPIQQNAKYTVTCCLIRQTVNVSVSSVHLSLHKIDVHSHPQFVLFIDLNLFIIHLHHSTAMSAAAVKADITAVTCCIRVCE